jgi:hypothetical protein
VSGKWLIGGAATLLVVLGVLMWKLERETASVGGGTTDREASPPARGAPSEGPAARRPPVGAPDPIRAAAGSATAPDESGDGGPVPLTRIVRDHTGETNTAPKSPIVPDTVAAIRREVTPKVQACIAQVPNVGTLPPKSRIQVELVAVSTGGKIAVKDAQGKTFEFEDAPFVACVQKAYNELRFDAPASQGEAEYSLLMTFPLR